MRPAAPATTSPAPGRGTPGAPRAAGEPPAPRRYRWGRADTISTVIVALLALVTRLVGLGRITDHGTPVFDEKHYAPQAFDIAVGGIETNPGFGLVVHPPLAKQLVALGEEVFGYGPWGWRIVMALLGCGAVLATMALVRRLSLSWRAATVAGLLGVVDGVLLVGARFGMLDMALVTFVVLAAWALVRDQQQVYARLFAARAAGTFGGSPLGPRLGFRWWRFAAGVFLGLAVSVKWSGLYYMAFFGLATVACDWWLRRRFAARTPLVGALGRDAFPAFASLVILPAGLYLWSWRSWFASETAHLRHAVTSGAVDQGSWLAHLPDWAAGFIRYHLDMLEFHGSLTTSGGHDHPWDSKPLSWLVAARPVLYYSDTDIECGAGTCRRMVYLFGTPAIWWLTVPVVGYAAWRLVTRRELAVVWPLVAFAAGFIPWLIAYDRQMYFFYAEPLVPFTIALLALACRRIARLGPPVAARWAASWPVARLAGGPLTWGGLSVAAYLALAVGMFIYFSPILYGTLIPDWWFQSMMWLPSWR